MKLRNILPAALPLTLATAAHAGSITVCTSRSCPVITEPPPISVGSRVGSFDPGSIYLSSPSGTITVSNPPDQGSITLTPVDPVGTPTNFVINLPGGESTSVIADGDLYLDYSIFSDSEDLNINGATRISGTSVNVFSYAVAPTLPTAYFADRLTTNNVAYHCFINCVLFGSSPIAGGTFEATGNIYIGNYSALAPVAPVPVPSSFWLFLSGAGWLTLKRRLAA